MAEDRQSELIEKFDTGELSQDIIPPNFTDPDVLFEVLKKIILTDHPGGDLVIIKKAYELAKEAHKDQRRKSGEPYLRRSYLPKSIWMRRRSWEGCSMMW